MVSREGGQWSLTINFISNLIRGSFPTNFQFIGLCLSIFIDNMVKKDLLIIYSRI